MLIAILGLLLIMLVLLIALLLRKTGPGADTGDAQRLSDSLLLLDRRVAELGDSVGASRTAVTQQIAEDARKARDEAGAANTALRTEIFNTLSDFRRGTIDGQSQLKADTEKQLHSVHERLVAFASDQVMQNQQLRDSVAAKFDKLTLSQTAAQEQLRATVQDRLDKLNEQNAAKLEEMRKTVDEKLHETLETRLTASFGLVTKQLGDVYQGLGEMKELATGVGDLKKIFANVKSRGGVGEYFLGNQLEEMLAPNQYIKNAQIKQHSRETVEYAIKVPSVDGTYILLPIDAKFPREDWERLEDAHQRAVPEEIVAAGKAFENAIKQEAKRICDKYIDPPATTPYAVLYLPTEGLYAEVVQRPGLLAELQSKCHITVAGPTTFMAILSSFQLVFHTVALQKKGEEVWKVLSAAKQQFDKFGELISTVEKQVGTVQNTLGKIGQKTRTINRSLKSVTTEDLLPDGGSDVPQLLPALAAVGAEEEFSDEEE